MKSYTAAAKRFYQSKAWRRCRREYAQHVGFCERCMKRGLAVAGEIVHHKIYLDDDKLRDPSIALNPENLELLCQDCHNREHFHTDRRRYSFDADGNVIDVKKESKT